MTAVKLAEEPAIDGDIREDEWKDASRVTGLIDPFTGKAAADQTEIWLGYTDQAIYVAFYARDSRPQEIVGREVTPGSTFEGEDTIAFRINTFGNRSWEGRNLFEVNVLNTQREQIAGGRVAKREWRGQWQSAVKRQPDGYSAEFRIPWDILDYPAGERTMDIEFIRYQARNQVRSRWASTTPDERPEMWGFWTGLRPPVKPTRARTEFLGYIAPEYEEGEPRVRAGLDVRHRMANGLTGLVSLFPDFRNIESEVAGIEFTRTERFLEEARPFFTEGNEFFDLTGPFTFGQLFYSRRIDSFDFGAKVFGRPDPSLGIGALATADKDGNLASVANVNKRFGPFANVSLFATALDRAGLQSTSIGMTGYKRWGNWWADTQLSSESTQGEGADSASAAALGYEVPKWFGLIRAESVDRGFDPPLGFIPWNDRKGYYLYTNHNNELRSGPFRQYGMDLFVPQFTTHSGEPQERGANVFGWLTTRSDIGLNFSRSEVTFPDGRDSLQSVGLTFNQSNRFKRFGASHEWGNRPGGRSEYTSLFGSYRIMPRFDIGVQISELRYQGEERQTVVTLGYEISRSQAVSGRLVARGSDTNAYLAFRQAGFAGTDVFLILGDPNADRTVTRVSLKLVAAF